MAAALIPFQGAARCRGASPTTSTRPMRISSSRSSACWPVCCGACSRHRRRLPLHRGRLPHHKCHLPLRRRPNFSESPHRRQGHVSRSLYIRERWRADDLHDLLAVPSRSLPPLPRTWRGAPPLRRGAKQDKGRFRWRTEMMHRGRFTRVLVMHRLVTGDAQQPGVMHCAPAQRKGVST